MEYKPSRQGFREMAVGPEITAAVRAVAEKARAYAVSISPRSDEHHEHYADSFVVGTAEVELTTGFGPTRRAAGIVENNSGHAAAVEWGNKHTPAPHRVLGRTLDHLRHL